MRAYEKPRPIFIGRGFESEYKSRFLKPQPIWKVVQLVNLLLYSRSVR